MTTLWDSDSIAHHASRVPEHDRIILLETQVARLHEMISDLNARWRTDRLRLAELIAAASPIAIPLAPAPGDDDPDPLERLTSADELTDIGLSYREVDAALRRQSAICNPQSAIP